jgi:hypothetical protein
MRFTVALLWGTPERLRFYHTEILSGFQQFSEYLQQDVP